MSTIANPDDIRHQVAELASRVEAVERQLAGHSNGTAEDVDLSSIMAEVREITQEIFPGECEFTNEFDFENPEDRYVVVNVEATGDIKEIAERGCAWHDRIRQLPDYSFGVLRLSIMPR